MGEGGCARELLSRKAVFLPGGKILKRFTGRGFYCEIVCIGSFLEGTQPSVNLSFHISDIPSSFFGDPFGGVEVATKLKLVRFAEEWFEPLEEECREALEEEEWFEN